MAAGPGHLPGVDVGLEPDDRRDGLDLGLGLCHLLNAPNDGVGTLDGGPDRHGKIDDGGLGVGVREKSELDPVAGHHPNRHHQDRQAHRDRHVAETQHHAKQPGVPGHDSAQDQAVAPCFEPPDPQRYGSRLDPVTAQQAVPHVAGKDQKRLDKAQRQSAGDDNRQRTDEIADLALDKPQRHEGDNAREDRGDHWPENLFGSLDGGDQGGFFPIVTGLNVLRHHDRVVDKQPQHHDQPEHRQQVQRDAQHGHEDQRAGERDDQPRSHPHRHTPVEKEKKRAEDEHRPPPRVSQKQIEPSFNEACQVRVRGQASGERLGTHAAEVVGSQPRRHQRARGALFGGRRSIQEAVDPIHQTRLEGIAATTGDIGSRHLGDLYGILVAGLKDGQRDRRLAVESRDQLLVDVVLANLGNVAQRQYLPLRRRFDDDPANVFSALRHTRGPHADIPRRGPHRPARHIGHPVADRLGHLRQAQPVLQQRRGGDIDPDLIVAHAGGEQLAHTGKRL